MKATINGIQVEGNPTEIIEFKKLLENKDNLPLISTVTKTATYHSSSLGGGDIR